ncbi:MAG: DNA translocase FtsK, partial [Chloroflexi bacterium]|nr:DNA translocase FtsK [Chloroflexota bacterium]
ERQITSSARAKASARPTPRKEAQKPPVRTAPASLPREEATAMPLEEPPFLHAEAPPEALPPLTLLTTDRGVESDEAEARERARLIEETLAAFGIPAEVVEWNRGPVVTQFGVEPGYIERPDRDGAPRRQKVRVSQILALQNDLALALAAAPIRIEAPVPGRSLVGIEVPNEVKATVGLRGVMESPQFRQLRSPLRIALGRSVSGEPVVADLTAMPHLLIAGATGTGKSVCLNAILIALLCQNTPEQLRLLLIDPKRVEFAAYNGIPHLLSPVVVEPERVVSALKWVVREMERRYREFAQVGARNLAAYNRTAAKRQMKPLPMIVVVIDELADLMLAAPEEVERTICRIAQMARATGIHLVIATQRPSVDVVTGLIKANFPARISFAVSSQVDSRVVLDAPGAEKLLGRGDMLYMAPDSPRLQRIQGCFVSDQEVRNVANFWRARAAQAWDQPLAQQEIPPWETAEAEAEENDELLQEAIALVRERRQASASFLQRHMRIGYPRAARLMDQLEKMGIVGPMETGGRSRAVLDPEGKPLPPSEDEA